MMPSEAAVMITMRLARAFDAQQDEEATLLRRVLTPVVKYWVCKRLPAVAAEAMEVMGGNGYVEENALARFYREAPLNSIWEGSGNVMCLDVMRAFGKTPSVRAALVDEVRAARGGNRLLDAFGTALIDDLGRGDIDEVEARAPVLERALVE